VLLRACLWIAAAIFIGSFVGGFLEGFVQGFIAALAHKGGPNASLVFSPSIFIWLGWLQAQPSN
jgi:hypothetical protein